MPEQNQPPLRVGAIYKMTLTEEDKMKLKAGAVSRDKYFVVLGFDGGHVRVASVIINSKINQKMLMSIGPFQHQLYGGNYSFMTKAHSYVDCSRLRAFSVDRMMRQAQYVGDLAADDLAEVMRHVKESRVILKETLLEFGLITQEEFDARGW